MSIKQVEINNFNDIGSVMDGWQDFVDQEREKELKPNITDERLKEPEARIFMENAFP